jgi:hypothetical protein
VCSLMMPALLRAISDNEGPRRWTWSIPSFVIAVIAGLSKTFVASKRLCRLLACTVDTL